MNKDLKSKTITVIPYEEQYAQYIDSGILISNDHALTLTEERVHLVKVVSTSNPYVYRALAPYCFITVADGKYSINDLQHIFTALKKISAYDLLVRFYNVEHSIFDVSVMLHRND